MSSSADVQENMRGVMADFLYLLDCVGVAFISITFSIPNTHSYRSGKKPEYQYVMHQPVKKGVHKNCVYFTFAEFSAS